MNQYQNFSIPIIQPYQPYGWEGLNQNLGSIGDFFKQNIERKQQMADAIQKLQIEAYLKQQFDPEAQFRNKIIEMMAGGGFSQDPTVQSIPEDTNWRSINSSINNFGNTFPQYQSQRQELPKKIQQSSGGFVPESFSYGGFSFKKPDSAQEKLEKSPFYQQNRFKKTEELLNTIEQGKIQKEMIRRARESSKNIPTGLGGKVKMWWTKMFDSENPLMEDWQNIKMVLTDAQLLNTAKTKGAISDREMELFSRAASNDDISSVRAMKPVFDKLVNFINAEEKVKSQAYKSFYGDEAMQGLYQDNEVNGNETNVQQSLPIVGSTFNGEKVIKVRQIK